MRNSKGPNLGAIARHHPQNRILSLLLLLCSTLILEAAVIDDFSGPTKKFQTGGGGMDYTRADLVNGQLVFSGDYPGPSSTSTPLVQWNNVYWPSSLPTVNLDFHTLEVRIDLVKISADDVFLGFGIDNGDGGYLVFVDQNEVALVKYSYSDSGIAAFCWTNAPVTNQNVKVVLAVTQMTNTVQLAMKFVELGSGRVLYERSFFDGPGRDFEAVTPRPKGMTIFGPDTGAAFTNFNIAFAGVFQWATNNPPPFQVVVDNLEYDLYEPPVINITNSVLLSWPENTVEEQIVVGTDSLSNAVWTPWPEPIFKRNGQLCLAVPATAQAQYFKLVPGTQLLDDFNGPSGLVASRNPWVPYFIDTNDIPRFSFEITNGTFRVHTITPPINGRVGFAFPGYPPGSPIFGDFTASVEIVGFTASGAYPSIVISGRGTLDLPFPGTSHAYLGSFSLLPCRIGIWDGANAVWGPPVVYDRTARHRLQFSAVDDALTLRLVNLKTGRTFEQKLVTRTFSHGDVGLMVLGAAGAPYDITLDNFLLTGTKP